MNDPIRLPQVEDYERFAGAKTIERILKKAKPLKDLHTVHVNSTYYGGGVSVLLSSLTLLMNNLGIKTGWRVIQGSPDFFSITKKMHNALQGEEINLSEIKRHIYEGVISENAVRNHLDHDIVIIHDPQPLPMIYFYRKKSPWIWRCHLDMSNPHKGLWKYLSKFIEKYDVVIFSLKEYAQNLAIPQLFFLPAIDPLTRANQELTDEEIDKRLKHYNIPTDLPIVTQISRFDRSKDPSGVIEAFKIARKEADSTLVLVGNVATDDPEGEVVYQSILDQAEERIVILSCQDTALVNALQTRAAVVLQKSLKEGFGLTVAEAMWKGAPVIGGDVGGIRYQIKDGVNGFLVSSVDQAADRIIKLVKDEQLRKKMGQAAKESVRENFLITRVLEQYLDLFGSFEAKFTVRNSSSK